MYKIMDFFNGFFRDCPTLMDKVQKVFAIAFWSILMGIFLFAALIDTPESILKYFLTIFAVEVLVFFIGFMLYKVYGHRGVITYAIASTFCTIGLILWTVLSVA
ncbi:MAG: hypothetical protein PUH03_00225 [bacterium]|nr:hypothetical protein [bacterium]MDY2830932.1 hypothetical protein [Alphaproteobacteria bacterium]